MPRGGRRPGAGRKPKYRPVIVLPSSPAAPPLNPPAPLADLNAPAYLSVEERAVWAIQAPHAVREQTLTQSTLLSFERYCRIAALEGRLGSGGEAGGADHRGILRQLNAYELQFKLTPCGKPVQPPVTAEKPDSEDETFFGGPIGVVSRSTA